MLTTINVNGGQMKGKVNYGMQIRMITPNRWSLASLLTSLFPFMCSIIYLALCSTTGTYNADFRIKVKDSLFPMSA